MADLGQVVTLYISDDAYNVLVEQARMAGFVKSDIARGMSGYIEWLMLHCTFTDTRPDDVKQADRDMMSQGYAPEWRMYGPRRRRNIKLSAGAMATASAEAVSLTIAHHPARRMLGAPSYMDGPACMSAILEALGTDWLKAEVTNE